MMKQDKKEEYNQKLAEILNKEEINEKKTRKNNVRIKCH